MENTEKDCCICGCKDSLFQVQGKWICEKCLDIGNEERSSLWKDSIEKLMKKYREACYKCLSSDDPEDIHNVRVLGRKIRSLLQFIGVPKKHPLLLPIRKVHLVLNKIREVDVFLDEIKQNSEENKFNGEIVQFLSEKQKEMKEQFNKILPSIINDSFHNKVEIFANEELVSFVMQLKKEKALGMHAEQFDQLVAAYYQTAGEKGKTSAETITLLHSVRKRGKSLRYIYNYLDEVFGGNYQGKEAYYKDLQSQFGMIKDLEDWLKLMKAFEKESGAPKRDVKEVRRNLQRRLKHLIENIELHPVPLNED